MSGWLHCVFPSVTPISLRSRIDSEIMPGAQNVSAVPRLVLIELTRLNANASDVCMLWEHQSYVADVRNRANRFSMNMMPSALWLTHVYGMRRVELQWASNKGMFTYFEFTVSLFLQYSVLMVIAGHAKFAMT